LISALQLGQLIVGSLRILGWTVIRGDSLRNLDEGGPDYILGTAFGKEQRANIESYPPRKAGESSLHYLQIAGKKHASAEARNSAVFGASRHYLKGARPVSAGRR
jgi:hypothetical protein